MRKTKNPSAIEAHKLNVYGNLDDFELAATEDSLKQALFVTDDENGNDILFWVDSYLIAVDYYGEGKDALCGSRYWTYPNEDEHYDTWEDACGRVHIEKRTEWVDE